MVAFVKGDINQWIFVDQTKSAVDLIASFKFAVSLAYMKSSIFLNQNLKLFVAPSQYNWYVELPMSKFPTLVINNFVGVYTGNFYWLLLGCVSNLIKLEIGFSRNQFPAGSTK